jgi:probable phosphoglycerate mutase
VTTLLFIRHGPTEWNEIGRVQGQTDTPLSEAGRARVKAWRVPALLMDHHWVSSPLARARETAEILSGRTPTLEPRIAEMHWGEWEGETLADLRARYGDAMVENEAKGLDFRAVGGESPREVCARIAAFLAERARAGRDVVAVSHKGVIRAALALATGWDMTGKPPADLDWDCAHAFTLDAEGCIRPARFNIPLAS